MSAIMKNNLLKADEKEALASYLNTLELLQSRGIIRSNNLVGDLGEYYAMKVLSTPQNQFELETKVNAGFDLTDSQGKRYEVKTRRIIDFDKSRTSKQIGRIGGLAKANADYLVIVQIDIGFLLKSIHMVEWKKVQEKNIHIKKNPTIHDILQLKPKQKFPV